MKFVLLGSGNVATHLGLALKVAGEEIIQVWSRSTENASALAAKLAASATSQLTEISSDADIYIVSVNDDAIKPVANQLSLQGKLIVHTSGSTDLEVLKDVSAKIGVFYPLQTFSKQKPVDFKTIPIAIEGSSKEVVEILTQVAHKISDKVFELSSAQRRLLHVAAVFACNFTNHLYALAADLLGQNNMDFDLIRPLIAETAEKIKSNEPREVQTGPAIRQDFQTLDKHLALLQTSPELAELYQKLSQSIVNFHKQG